MWQGEHRLHCWSFGLVFFLHRGVNIEVLEQPHSSVVTPWGQGLVLCWALLLLECSPGLPLTSALPKLEWNHLIKAGRESKMGFERSNWGLSCRPAPSAQRGLLLGEGRARHPPAPQRSPKSSFSPLWGTFWAFMGVRKRGRSSHVAQIREIVIIDKRVVLIIKLLNQNTKV